MGINEIIAPKLVGLDPTKQSEIDKMMVETLDGSQNEWGWSKAKLGANAILAVSMAVARAGAASKSQPLYKYIAELAGKPTDKYVMPVPSFNVINGGSHAGNRLACQEFMILPVGASSFKEAMQNAAEDMKKTGEEMIAYYEDWANNYPFVSIEDPFDQDDWEAYAAFQEKIGEKIQIVGDDLLVTNPKRVTAAIEKKACNP